MLAGRNGSESDGWMSEVRRGDDDGVNVVALYDFIVIDRPNGYASLLLRPIQALCVGIAKGSDFDLRAQGQSRQMILQRDPATANDGNAYLTHEAADRIRTLPAESTVIF
jgi:hypothetical protein